MGGGKHLNCARMHPLLNRNRCLLADNTRVTQRVLPSILSFLFFCACCWGSSPATHSVIKIIVDDDDESPLRRARYGRARCGGAALRRRGARCRVKKQ